MLHHVYSSTVCNLEWIKGSITRWILKVWHIYTIKYYIAIKKDEILPCAAKWILEDIMLNKVRRQILHVPPRRWELNFFLKGSTRKKFLYQYCCKYSLATLCFISLLNQWLTMLYYRFNYLWLLYNFHFIFSIWSLFIFPLH